MTDKPLSLRHQRFVHEYLKDGNATQAYIRAGYSARGAQSCASRLLAQPHIQAALADGRQRVAEALEVSVVRLAQEYAKIAFASIDDFIAVDADGRPRVDMTKASQAQRAGLVELTITERGTDRGANHGKPSQTVKLKLNKLQALAALTRHVELFTKPATPGLSPEDRERYEATIADHEGNWQHALEQMRRLELERDTAEVALAAANAKLAGTPWPEVPQPEPRSPQAPRPSQTMASAETRAQPPQPLQPPKPPQITAPGFNPTGKIVWTSRRDPLEPLEPDDPPRMACEYDVYARG